MRENSNTINVMICLFCVTPQTVVDSEFMIWNSEMTSSLDHEVWEMMIMETNYGDFFGKLTKSLRA